MSSTENKLNTVLCAIQFSNLEPWITIQSSGQYSTFLSEPAPKGVTCLYFKGKDVGSCARWLEQAHERIRYRRYGSILTPVDRLATYPIRSFRPTSKLIRGLQGVDTLEIDIPDLFPLLLWKYLGLYRYFIEQTEFNFLFTTNSNCYLRLHRLSELVQGVPSLSTYAGTPLKAGERDFVSGANRLMSRDVVKLILNSCSEIDRGYIEDVSQGIFLTKKDLIINPLPTEDIHSMEEAKSLEGSRLKELHQIRIKTKHSRQIDDVKIMKYIHSRVNFNS